MDAEQLVIARRLAACSKWVWLPGMQMVVHRCLECLPTCEFTGAVSRIVSVDDRRPGTHKICRISGPVLDDGLHDNVPDLDDELTRFGVLAVVRRALGMPSLAAVLGDDGWYLFGVPSNRPELLWSTASEIEALCFALEAAR